MSLAVLILLFLFCKHQYMYIIYKTLPRGVCSSTRKLISSSSFHRLDMTLAVAEALNPNKPKNPRGVEQLICTRAICVLQVVKVVLQGLVV